MDKDLQAVHQSAAWMTICDGASQKDRSLLGKEQEAWLYRGLGTFDTRWNTLVQNTMLGSYDFVPGHDHGFDLDGWDGYSTSRDRLLSAIKSRKPSNSVAIGGNIHAYYAGFVSATEGGQRTPLISEIVGTSISSSGGGEARYRSIRSQFSQNPDARYFDNRYRGYALCDATPQSWNTSLRVIENVRDPDSPARTLATITVESGRCDTIVS